MPSSNVWAPILLGVLAAVALVILFTNKYVPYMIRNMVRNKLRSLFTMISIAIMLFLVSLLYAYTKFQDEFSASTAQYNRIIVSSTQGLTFPLPRAHLDKIRGIEEIGESAATPMTWYGGLYADEKLAFAEFGTDPNTVLQVYNEYSLTPEELQAWKDDKQGCVLGAGLARNRGWKVGDRIPLKGAIYNVDLEFTVRGILDGPDKGGHDQSLWFNGEYLENSLRQKDADNRMAGRVGIVTVKAKNAAMLASLMDGIDSKCGAVDPVRSMTEQAFQNQFTEMAGNVQAFIRNIALAVVFALICVAGNAMAMAMRERTREVAVLKAIGFQRSTVLGMILGEAELICLMGGLVGVLGAKLLFDVIDASTLGIPQLALFYVPWITVVIGMGLAAFVGLASGAVPAWRAAQLSVVDGLRRVI